MEHHPIADLFPMLPEDELKELAADIAERGLLQPIVLDTEGRILDGRNRYAACELASVKPAFQTYEGDDATGYAVAVNVNRRNLTKGQQAMVVARASKLEGFGTKAKVARSVGVQASRVAEAVAVLDYAPELADEVVAGGKRLDEAYAVARQNKKATEDYGQRVEALRKLAPDLAVLVENEVRGLDDALREAENRKIVAEIDAIRDADGAPAPSFGQRAEEGAITWEEAATLAQQWQDERDESVRRDQDRIRSVASAWGAVRTVKSQPKTKYVADVLDGLGESDRAQLDNIIAAMKG